MSLEKISDKVNNQSILFFIVTSIVFVYSLTTTDRMLFAEDNIPLPILEVPLKITTFFKISPFLVILTQLNYYFYLIRYSDLIEREKKYFRNQPSLSINLLDSFLIGSNLKTFSKGLLNFFVRYTTIFFTFFYPVIVLLSIQLQFSKYQSTTWTPIHFILFLFGLFLSCLSFYSTIIANLKHKYHLAYLGLISFSILFFIISSWNIFLFYNIHQDCESNRFEILSFLNPVLVVRNEDKFEKKLDLKDRSFICGDFTSTDFSGFTIDNTKFKNSTLSSSTISKANFSDMSPENIKSYFENAKLSGIQINTYNSFSKYIVQKFIDINKQCIEPKQIKDWNNMVLAEKVVDNILKEYCERPDYKCGDVEKYIKEIKYKITKENTSIKFL
ncbi:MAG: hypothetical protein KDK54_21295 [Leptospiraceae bacterium]|nr:hypothetical protein [Leptospiraceae bacterium]